MLQWRHIESDIASRASHCASPTAPQGIWPALWPRSTDWVRRTVPGRFGSKKVRRLLMTSRIIGPLWWDSTGGFLSQRVRYTEVWYFYVVSFNKLLTKQSIGLLRRHDTHMTSLELCAKLWQEKSINHFWCRQFNHRSQMCLRHFRIQW